MSNKKFHFEFKKRILKIKKEKDDYLKITNFILNFILNYFSYCLSLKFIFFIFLKKF